MLMKRICTNATGIVNPYHQPIFIINNIDYDSAAFEDAGIFEVRFYLRRGYPVNLEGMSIPS